MQVTQAMQGNRKQCEQTYHHVLCHYVATLHGLQAGVNGILSRLLIRR